MRYSNIHKYNILEISKGLRSEQRVRSFYKGTTGTLKEPDKPNPSTINHYNGHPHLFHSALLGGISRHTPAPVNVLLKHPWNNGETRRERRNCVL